MWFAFSEVITVHSAFIETYIQPRYVGFSLNVGLEQHQTQPNTPTSGTHVGSKHLLPALPLVGRFAQTGTLYDSLSGIDRLTPNDTHV